MDNKQALHISMLGSFSIRWQGDRVLSDQSCRHKKVLSLLAYLIAFRSREITRSELVELLWPDDEVDDPANALKTLVHRARSFLDELGFAPGKEVLQSHRGAYAWNNALPVVVDAEEFDGLCVRLRGAEKDRALLLQAIDLYTGDFLPQNALEPWVVPINTYYRAQYLKLVHEAIRLLTGEQAYDEVISICQRAINVDPYDEGLHLAMITALNAAGMQERALAHYNYVTDLFMTKFGVNPSAELTAQYKEIIKTSKESEMDLRLIRDELSEREKAEGAFFCEYEFFKDIYRLNAREAVRSGYVVCIALLTVMDGAGKPMSQKKRNLTMERLMGVLNSSLRRGDVCTRYSVSQYLLMLPTASYENSSMVLERICRNYKQAYPHMNTLLHYSVLPMEPIM